MQDIFLSYRREDSAGYAGRLYDKLREHFNKRQIFLDIDTINPGADFVVVIEETLDNCVVLLALIGLQWLSIKDNEGKRRIDNPNDYVRLEIETALKRNILVIPLLVQGVSMPRAEQLPDEIEALTRRNALVLSDLHFHHDCDNLIDIIQEEIVRVSGVPLRRHESATDTFSRAINSTLNNSDFVKSRSQAWTSFAQDKIWLVTSITPFEIDQSVIDPQNNEISETMQTIELPKKSVNCVVNRFHTKPNMYGLINEDLRELENGFGHRFQVFRNGHCEFLICLEGSTREITNYIVEKDNADLGGNRVLRYTDLADSLIYQIKGLFGIWKNNLPFDRMLLNSTIINTSSTFLYSKERKGTNPIYGSPVSSPSLNQSLDLELTEDTNSVSLLVLQYFVNCYGLVLKSLCDSNGKLSRPEFLTA